MSIDAGAVGSAEAMPDDTVTVSALRVWLGDSSQAGLRTEFTLVGK